jgi:NAD(P)-dependent dehydrogenase (short-subunit alcohol dehydrogenase family)
MRDVAGRVAVITGGASGIGRGMAESFAAAGMRLVLADVERGALEKTSAALREAGAEVHAVPTDVSKAEQVQALADETLSRFGAVHVVCNNAGIGVGAASIWETSLDDWEWILGVNLMGVIYGVRTFVPILVEQGEESHVVNTASLAGLVGGEGAYGVTKFGVVALSESLHFGLERAGAKTKASVLCPGFVATDIMDSERNRPPELSDASPEREGPEAGLMREWVEEQLEAGASPRSVGDQVLAAIREERFYILTHPDWNPLIEHRMTGILEGRNPSMLPFPGAESLMEKLARLAE